MAKRGAGTKAAAGVIVDTVAGVIVDAKGVVTPVPGRRGPPDPQAREEARRRAQDRIEAAPAARRRRGVEEPKPGGQADAPGGRGRDRGGGPRRPPGRARDRGRRIRRARRRWSGQRRQRHGRRRGQVRRIGGPQGGDRPDARPRPVRPSRSADDVSGDDGDRPGCETGGGPEARRAAQRPGEAGARRKPAATKRRHAKPAATPRRRKPAPAAATAAGRQARRREARDDAASRRPSGRPSRPRTASPAVPRRPRPPSRQRDDSRPRRSRRGGQAAHDQPPSRKTTARSPGRPRSPDDHPARPRGRIVTTHTA